VVHAVGSRTRDSAESPVWASRGPRFNWGESRIDGQRFGADRGSE
jgi:hypothetical protein